MSLQTSQQNGKSALTPTLQSMIRSRFADSDFPPGVGAALKYLPQNQIPQLVTEEIIANVLGFKDPNSRKLNEKFIDWIRKDAPKLFLIVANSMVAISPDNIYASMQQFWTSGFDDSHLPWSEQNGYPDDTMEGCIWNRSNMIEHFQIAQAKLLPLAIRAKIFYNKIAPGVILPFTLVKDEAIKQGTFGKVYRVTIHGSQTDCPFHDIAVKEIQNVGSTTDTSIKDAWVAETVVLQTIRQIQTHHLIYCLAALERGDERYLLFPWADGGSLRDYWKDYNGRKPLEKLVKEAVVQISGLAAAITQLHYFGLSDDSEEEPDDQPHVNTNTVVHEYNSNGAQQSIRHGDLKPENLLWFTEKNEQNEEAQYLKIADMGLAKRHFVATQDRSGLTATRYGTILYEAPEAGPDAEPALGKQPRSRLYDIWSMGCIITEWIIWILYGKEGLQKFYDDLRGPYHNGTTVVSYYSNQGLDSGNPSPEPKLHPQVIRWMSHMKNKHPECQQESAIRDLLRLVEERLLIFRLPDRRPTTLNRARSQGIAFPPPSGDQKVRYRATSIELGKEIDNILRRIKSESRYETYLLTSTEEQLADAKPPSRRQDPGSLLHPNMAVSYTNQRQSAVRVDIQQPSTRNNYTLPLLEHWKFSIDNGFASNFASRVGHGRLAPESTSPAQLCTRCSQLKFLEPGFSIEDDFADWAQRPRKCDFCDLLRQAWSKSSVTQSTSVAHFERVESIIVMRGAKSLAALSLIAAPGNSSSASEIQIGFPQLPDPDSDLSSCMMQQWLQDCDEHIGCRSVGNAKLPTRLIYVGSEKEPILRLVETTNGLAGDSRYVALSHRWGDAKECAPFCTLLDNLKSFQEDIPTINVPQTFRDAITVTRRLGIQYLWIDSLCIIQGDGGDFNKEAKRMEDVFSCAYCVIAASRASNQREGFLHRERSQRRFITIHQGRQVPFYVCEAIDDFGRDVLDGALNSRGWVLQERALARRTIYFTGSQMYFECGMGVRCETLAKMQNDMADFLGDPRFPEKAMREKSRAIKIRYFQDLYRRYSRLEFSHIQDRPIAIAGLENRLRTAYSTKGGYGIFDDGPGHGLFNRSLLWQRGEDEATLEAIDFSSSPESAAPTWSWMAYKGGIDYLDPAFQQMEWEGTEIEPPWSVTGGGSDGSHSTSYLKVVVRSFSVAGAPGHKSGEIKFRYDNPHRPHASDRQSPTCVVVAREKRGNSVEEKRHYVLVVVGGRGVMDQGRTVFSRIGVGYMPGYCIALKDAGVKGLVR